MTWTQTDLNNIEAAIAKGERRLQLNGRSVEYHSVGDMLAARDAISRALNTQAATEAGVRRPVGYRARTRKGL